MQTSTRVIFNTIVLYVKVILSLAIAFVSIPLVLNALGASDYGLYNLVAGVVAMLSFLNNSMTVSTQRFMSVAMGEKNEEKHRTGKSHRTAGGTGHFDQLSGKWKDDHAAAEDQPHA